MKHSDFKNQLISSLAHQLISSSANHLILLAIIISANLLICSSILAQTPQKLNYQAIIRNSSGALVSGQTVGMRISILQGSASGTAVYVETHKPTTNVNGLATVVIGDGSLVSGTLATINWASGTYYLKTETDPAGGTSYTIVGTSQLLSVPYALNSKTSESVADNSVTSAKVVDATISAADLAANSVTTDKINAGAVTGAKIAQAGATSGQALKWNGTTWAPAADVTGGGSGGWSDDGTMIRLSTSTDSVQMGSTSSLGKFNVGGNIGLNTTSSIYFGSDATRITGITGGDMRLVADDLSMLTTGNITFGHYGDETWIEFDNDNKRVGIGTLAPTDRLHVVQNVATAGLSAIRGVATPTTVSNNGVYGESMSATGYGLYGKSPKYGVYGTSTGNQGRGVVGEATGTASIGVQGIATNTSSTGVWGEGSNQGIYGYSSSTAGKGVYGKVTSPEGYSGYFEGGQFYVKGSAQVEDTLYANVVKAAKITTQPGLAHNIEGSDEYDSWLGLGTSWTELNSVTIDVPAPGYVLIFASCNLLSEHDLSDITWVTLGVSKTSDGWGIKEIGYWFINPRASSMYIREFISAQAPLQVAKAGSQTFYLMGYRKPSDSTPTMDAVYRLQSSLTAIYIPVAYGTVE
jgi:hypothetical protein